MRASTVAIPSSIPWRKSASSAGRGSNRGGRSGSFTCIVRASLRVQTVMAQVAARVSGGVGFLISHIFGVIGNEGGKQRGGMNAYRAALPRFEQGVVIKARGAARLQPSAEVSKLLVAEVMAQHRASRVGRTACEEQAHVIARPFL